MKDGKLVQQITTLNLSEVTKELNDLKRIIEYKNYNLNLDGEKINKNIEKRNKAKQSIKDKATIIKKYKK